MRIERRTGETDGLATLASSDTQLLGAKRERQLLLDLAECKSKLAKALASIPGASPPEGVEDPQALSLYIARAYASDGLGEARLGAIYRRYNDLRSQLALANMRLVAHVAKRFRDRGVSYSDLLQEGFCGLLEAIDRFKMTHETKLATYATWWIRQSMQRAVAGGAYPVRLSPRHLRQLAQNQGELDHAGQSGVKAKPSSSSGASAEMIQRIHTATRPTVSLDASLDREGNFSLLQIMSDPDGDRTVDVDLEESITRLMAGLRPREQQVLSLRFGLGGQARLSLSQVGKVLAVSKERIRQIQDRALEKLREAAEENGVVFSA